MREFVTVMKALSEPNRVRIVKLTAKRPLCVCELTELLGLAQPTVSKHLGILEQAGLVSGHREGQWTLYESEMNRSEYARHMLEAMQGWLEDDPEMAGLYARLDTVDKHVICARAKNKNGTSK
jgi:ArsR family transcriptional regulator